MGASLSRGSLLFVYAVDGGIFNAVVDSVHKLLSPKTYACNLCALTYGWTSAHRQWTDLVRGLKLGSEFLHRDELLTGFQGARMRYRRSSFRTPEVCD